MIPTMSPPHLFPACGSARWWSTAFPSPYAMTGWPSLGYACAPAEIMSVMVKIHQYAIMSAPTTAQFAAIEALRNGDADIAEMREEYDQRRRFVCDRLNSLGLTCYEPRGAFYIFPSIAVTGLGSEEFCERLLKTRKVAVIPRQRLWRMRRGLCPLLLRMFYAGFGGGASRALNIFLKIWEFTAHNLLGLRGF